MDKDIVAAGDSARLEVIFNTRSYLNVVTKSPRIVTNEDSAGPPNMVRIRAEIDAQPDSTRPVVIRPYKIDISQFSEKPREEVSFTIEDVSENPVSLTLVSVPSEFIEVQLPATIEPGKTGQGIVMVRKDALEKQFDKSFTFEVNDEKHTRFTVPVKREVRIQGQL